ncbi:hypothetical protein AB0891_25585 [Streptomyces sp. NPDC007259]|uniref:hypothetical protein n=1 Tax=Streptomyces sp. NPDC007259 TaxID=3154319 RepID=UPI0034523BBE
MADNYVWTRREDETSPAYEAFRTYLGMGASRSLSKLAGELNKSMQLLAGWSSKHDWVDRVRAHDQYLASAATDGLASQMASARDDNLELAATLRAHLTNQLAIAMQNRDDPSVRWSQALAAMVRLEEHAFRLKDDPKTSQLRDRAKELVRRLEEAGRQ